jgi:hypothetical protein
MVNTYIHPNDCEPIRSEPLSPPLMYSVTFPEFRENNSLNQKNNYSTSGFMSFNSPSKLTSLNSSPTLFSSVFSHRESEQHLNSKNVFPPLSSLSPKLSHSPKVDSPYTNSKFENLLLHFTYRSSTSPPSSPSSNQTTNNSMTSKQFGVFHQLPVHVFSSSSFFYYSLH